jgi:hypothetical protein
MFNIPQTDTIFSENYSQSVTWLNNFTLTILKIKPIITLTILHKCRIIILTILHFHLFYPFFLFGAPH